MIYHLTEIKLLLLKKMNYNPYLFIALIYCLRAKSLKPPLIALGIRVCVQRVLSKVVNTILTIINE